MGSDRKFEKCEKSSSEREARGKECNNRDYDITRGTQNAVSEFHLYSHKHATSFILFKYPYLV